MHTLICLWCILLQAMKHFADKIAAHAEDAGLDVGLPECEDEVTSAAQAEVFMKSDASLWTELVKAQGGCSQADVLSTIRRMQQLQRCAEAAGRVEPLQRSAKQLQAIIQYVGAAAPFRGMSADQLANIARSVDLIHTTYEERIVTEGTVGSAFFVVLAGEYSVYQHAVLEAQSRYAKCAAFSATCCLIGQFPLAASVHKAWATIRVRAAPLSCAPARLEHIPLHQVALR